MRRVKKKVRIVRLILGLALLSLFFVMGAKLLAKGAQGWVDKWPGFNGASAEAPAESPFEFQVQPAPANYIDYQRVGGVYELPVNGASGFAAMQMNLMETSDTESAVLMVVNAGNAFKIIEEQGDWWLVEVGDTAGWVLHRECFINLPDIVPSIVYNVTNAAASAMTSSNHSIPDITGEKLYDAWGYNKRFEEYTYWVPIKYSMAAKVCAAQQRALAQNETLIIYEGFRPHDVQRYIIEKFKALVAENPAVRKGIIDGRWSMSWFISLGTSNHQRGTAIDVGLGRILSEEKRTTGAYAYRKILDYEPYTMPTGIHDLSIAARVFDYPVASQAGEEWRSTPLSSTLNDSAVRLQQYCTDAGMTPLASEWWHFNDFSSASVSGIEGRFRIIEIKSAVPAFCDMLPSGPAAHGCGTNDRQ